ncbi:MAG: ATP-binding protein [Gammaproteobacteria bacterium]|nr:ATP-binding protein [Gammaproteobacteria bacterium]
MSNTSRLLSEKVQRVIFSADIQVSAILDKIDSFDFQTSEELSLYYSNPEIYDLMDELILRTTDIDALSIVDGKGLMYNIRNTTSKPIDVSHREHFKGLRDHPDQSLFITKKFVSVLTGQDIIVFARQLKRFEEKYQGLVSAVVSTSRFTKAFTQALPDSDSQIYLMDLRGNVLAAAQNTTSPSTDDPAFHQKVLSIAHSGTPGTFEFRNSANQDSLRQIAIHTVSGYPLVLAIERSHKNIDRPWLELSTLIVSFTLFIVTLGLLAIWFFNKQYRTEKMLVDTADQLTKALETAKNATEAKSRFLANMSHEIRTPLNAVLGMANIGIRDSSDARGKETFAHVLDSGQHLLGIINDVLELSKIEAGKLTTETRPFQLISTVENTVNMMLERALAKDLKLSVDLPGYLPGWVLGDSRRLQQILLNLLSNAIKFTEKGEVIVSVSRENDLTFIKVTDSGIGLSEEQIPRLFTPFEQADTSTTRKFGGTGLGLTISHNLAQLMGGNLHVKSQVKKGSVFTLSLPLKETTAPDMKDLDTPGISDPQLAGLRVLAAEDVEINRLILEDMLQQEGATVVFAEDGQQAIDCLKEIGADNIDVILMDIQMPVMDGYEATRRIIQIAPKLPIIGVTAHALLEERNKCLTAGMVDRVTKPIDAASLIEVIRKQVEDSVVISESN